MVVEVKPAAGALNNGKRLGKICRLHLGAGEFIMLDSLPVVRAVLPDTARPGTDRLVAAVRSAGPKPVQILTDLVHRYSLVNSGCAKVEIAQLSSSLNSTFVIGYLG